MARFRYRLQAALDHARALEWAAARAVRHANDVRRTALASLALHETPIAATLAAAEFAWAATAAAAARRGLRTAGAAHAAALAGLVDRRRRCEALVLHRARCASRFAAAAARVDEADLEELNRRRKDDPNRAFERTAIRV